jgi:hypothetical protein
MPSFLPAAGSEMLLLNSSIILLRWGILAADLSAAGFDTDGRFENVPVLDTSRPDQISIGLINYAAIFKRSRGSGPPCVELACLSQLKR